MRKLNPGHIGRRRVLSPQGQPCHLLFTAVKFSVFKKILLSIGTKSTTNPTNCQGLQNCYLLAKGKESSPPPSTFAIVFHGTHSLLPTCRVTVRVTYPVWLLGLVKGLEFSASLSLFREEGLSQPRFHDLSLGPLVFDQVGAVGFADNRNFPLLFIG